MKAKSLSRVRLFKAPWTVAYQAPLSMGFPRPEYWSGLPFPSQGIFVIWKSWGKGLPYVSKKLAGGWKCSMSWLLSPSRVFPQQFRICIERFNCRRNKKQPLQRFIRTWRNLQACCLILTQYTILYQFLYSTLIIRGS